MVVDASAFSSAAFDASAAAKNAAIKSPITPCGRCRRMKVMKT